MQNEQLTIVARILAKEEKRDLVKSELLKLIAITREEQGCINYDLHQDNENPNLFLFHENWESYELWQKHMANAHLAEYVKATSGCIEEFTISFTSAFSILMNRTGHGFAVLGTIRTFAFISFTSAFTVLMNRTGHGLAVIGTIRTFAFISLTSAFAVLML